MLFVNRWVGYNEGGTESHIKDILLHMAKAGHEIDVITVGGDKIAGLHEHVRVVPVRGSREYYSYHGAGLFHACLYLIRVWKAYSTLRRKGRRYDVVSAFFSLEAFGLRFIRCWYGCPYALVLDGDTPLEIIEGRRANRTSHISRFMAQQSTKYGYETALLPKGLDTERFHSSHEVADLRSQLSPNGEKVVLAVCRLDPRKDLSTLVHGVRHVLGRGRVRVRCVLVGDGVERQALEALVRELELVDAVTFVGSVPNDSDLLPKYYCAADLFVLPTLYEGFGWVFQEAMACGLPILTTDAGSNPEVVGGVGVLLPVRDPKRMGDEMERLLCDPVELDRMRAAGHERVRQFEWPRLLERYEKFYSEVAATQTPGFLRRIADLVAGLAVDGFAIARQALRVGAVKNAGGGTRDFRNGGQVGNRAS